MPALGFSPLRNPCIRRRRQSFRLTLGNWPDRAAVGQDGRRYDHAEPEPDDDDGNAWQNAEEDDYRHSRKRNAEQFHANAASLHSFRFGARGARPPRGRCLARPALHRQCRAWLALISAMVIFPVASRSCNQSSVAPALSETAPVAFENVCR